MSRIIKATRFQADARLRNRPTVVKVGKRSQIFAELHSWGSTRAVYADPAYVELNLWGHSLHEGDLFVDVGANVGIFSILAAEQGCEVIAIEPDPVSAQRLRRNAEFNNYQIDLREVALWDGSVKELRVTSMLDDCNHVLIGPSGEPSSTVPASSLDEILGNRTAFVKIDVEGAELRVLEGAQRALRERRLRLIQLEWNDCSVQLLGLSRRPVEDLLTTYGYSLHRLGPDGRTLIPTTSPGYGADVFAVPND